MLYKQRPGQQLPRRRQLWSELWTLRSMGYSGPLPTQYIQVSFTKNNFQRILWQASGVTELWSYRRKQRLLLVFSNFKAFAGHVYTRPLAWKSRFLLLNFHINCFGILTILMYSSWVAKYILWMFRARNVCVAAFLPWLFYLKIWDF